MTRAAAAVLAALVLAVAPVARAQQAEQGLGGSETSPPETGGAPPQGQTSPQEENAASTGAPEGEGGDEGGDEGDEEQQGSSSSGGGGAAPSEAAPDAGPAGTTVSYAGRPESPDRYRLLVPPLLVERDGDVHTTTVFPFFWERSATRDDQFLAGLYYRRRGVQGNADAIAPVWFNFWDDHSSTVIVPPVYSYSHDGGVWDFGVAPLVFAGRHDRNEYLAIPPLLTLSWRTSQEAHTIAGPYFRFRSGEDVDWGVFPLVWSLQHVAYDDEIVAPFFWRFHVGETNDTLTAIPPFHVHEFRGGSGWGLTPLAYWESSAHGSALTLPALLFHYSDNDRGGHHLITPLFGFLEDPAETCTRIADPGAPPCVPHVASTTLVTPLYQRYRGATWLDATAPLFFAWGDDRDQSGHWLLPPFFYREASPAAIHTIAFPFFAQFSERGRYDSWATLLTAHWESHTRNANATWVFPNVQVSNDETSSTVNVWPLLFHTEAPTWRSNVVLGLYYDFEHDDHHARETVAFPFVWRFADGPNVQQVVLNTYYHHWNDHGVPGWEIHVFPFFAWGSHGPDDEWWTVLYGLAGWQRHGHDAHVQALWLLNFDASSH